MARPFVPKVLTANHLLDGEVIYLTSRGEWTRKLQEALLIDDESMANAALAKAEQESDTLLDPYLADSVPDINGRPCPAHFREAYRSRGPSNYYHGKQAED